MPIEISTDLQAPLVPLAWLLGRWEGAGVVGYPTIEERRFGQEVEFRHDGRPFLHYRSQAYLLDDDRNQVLPLPARPGTGGSSSPMTSRPPPGRPPASTSRCCWPTRPGSWRSTPAGRTGRAVDHTTDVVARTVTAKEYTAAQRMYGMVEGDLLEVMDMAAVGRPMTSHASARLKKV